MEHCQIYEGVRLESVEWSLITFDDIHRRTVRHNIKRSLTVWKPVQFIWLSNPIGFIGNLMRSHSIRCCPTQSRSIGYMCQCC